MSPDPILVPDADPWLVLVINTLKQTPLLFYKILIREIYFVNGKQIQLIRINAQEKN